MEWHHSIQTAQSVVGSGSCMPVRYIIDKERRLVLTTGEGAVTVQETLTHRDQLLRDPDFDPSFNQLNDYTKVTDVLFSVHEQSPLARLDEFSPTSRRAIVVSTPAHYGMARQFQVYQEGRSMIQVFCDRAAALQWLGIPEDSRLY